MLDAIRFVASNGVRRTIKDAVMRSCEQKDLGIFLEFEQFLERELGEYAMRGLVDKFYKTRNALAKSASMK